MSNTVFMYVFIDVFKCLVCHTGGDCLCVLSVTWQLLGVPEDAVLCKKSSSGSVTAAN